MDRFLERLAALQGRRYGWFLIVGVLLGVASIPLMTRLELNSDWSALLPRETRSVRDLEQGRRRVGGLATLTVFVTSESADTAAMRRLAATLVPRLESLRGPQTKVRTVDWNVRAYAELVERHRQLYADLPDLITARDALRDRLEWERASANPMFIALDDPPPDPREVVRELVQKARAKQSRSTRDAEGFHVHRSGKLLAIYLRTDIAGGDAAATARLIARIDREVIALRPASFGRDLKVEYAGDLVVAREEHEAIAKELLIATVLTVVLCLLSIQLFFFRVRAIFLLGGSLLIPVVVTFAVAELAVDYLNAATAFLGSIVIGNGINPMIVWLARYFEERRNGLEPVAAVAATHRGVWSGTLTASAAAAVAYGSLVVTDFRGFRDFGIIGGAGMMICWLATALLLPAAVLLSERVRPISTERTKVRKNFYGVAISKLVFGAPRVVAAIALLLGIGGAALTARWVTGDPFEYDFRRLRSIREGSTRGSWLNARAKEIGLGGRAQNAMVLLVPAREDAAMVRAELERRRERAGREARYGRVRTIDDLLPKEQEAKLRVLAEIREHLLDARRFAREEDQRHIDEHLPAADLRPLQDADLPEDVARVFTERDGTRGRIVLVEPRRGATTWNGLNLVRMTEAIREVRLPDGSRPLLVGRGPIFADMLEVILVDGPKAVLVAFIATILLVLVTFRRMTERLLTLGGLLVGVLIMTGAMAALDMKLNFLNFVALPITFGIGVDYAVNVMRRYASEHAGGAGVPAAIRASLEETGGAVILCSLTTIFGYLSLYSSANLALNSFGQAMSIGEVACLAAAILMVPALQLMLGARAGSR